LSLEEVLLRDQYLRLMVKNRWFVLDVPKGVSALKRAIAQAERWQNELPE
jgi:hypothetical protein